MKTNTEYLILFFLLSFFCILVLLLYNFYQDEQISKAEQRHIGKENKAEKNCACLHNSTILELKGLIFKTESHKNLADAFHKSIMTLKSHGLMTASEEDRISRRYMKWLNKHTYTLSKEPLKEQTINS